MDNAQITPPGRLHRWVLPALLFASGPLVLSAQAADEGVELEDLQEQAGRTPSVTTTLIQRLVARGVLTQEDSADLLLLAEADAQELKAQKALARAALAQAAAAQARARVFASQLARQQGGKVKTRALPRDDVDELLQEDELADEPMPSRPRRAASSLAQKPSAQSRSRDAGLLALDPRDLDRPPVRRSVQPDLDADAARDESISLPDEDNVVVAKPRVRTRAAEPSSTLLTDNNLDDLPSPKVARTTPRQSSSMADQAPSTDIDAPIVSRPSPVAEAQEVEQSEPVRSAAVDPLAAEAAPEAAPDEVRVRYVPESVRRQITAEVKQEVMAQARAEGWATPRSYPTWLDRLSFFGDFRFRTEGIFNPSENVSGPLSSLWNFNAINTASTPYDLKGDAEPPYVNTTEDRNRIRVRARLGVNADLSEGFTAGLRLATGETNSPVSQNQSLGYAGSGQGGGFGKLGLWLDRAFLRYELGGLPDETTMVSLGRFDRPYHGTSMVWSDDLGFDGLALSARRLWGDSIVPFLTLGAHPVFNTDLNFGSTNYAKFKSRDKWLLAGQIGVEMDLAADVTAKFSAAYYHFQNVEGAVSEKVLPFTASDSFAGDASRPSFAQRGNTYIALRDILPSDTVNANGSTKQWQYFGLASPFHEAALNAEVNFDQFSPARITLFGELIKNLAFDRADVLLAGPTSFRGPVNNNSLAITDASGKVVQASEFGGSGMAWTAGVRFGRAALEQRWDWNSSLSYRDVGSDSVVDGFADSDFGGGGTNQKGFVLAGNLALSKSVWLGAKWMSATQKAGPSPLKNDTLQIDINGKF